MWHPATSGLRSNFSLQSECISLSSFCGISLQWICSMHAWMLCQCSVHPGQPLTVASSRPSAGSLNPEWWASTHSWHTDQSASDCSWKAHMMLPVNKSDVKLMESSNKVSALSAYWWINFTQSSVKSANSGYIIRYCWYYKIPRQNIHSLLNLCWPIHCPWIQWRPQSTVIIIGRRCLMMWQPLHPHGSGVLSNAQINPRHTGALGPYISQV